MFARLLFLVLLLLPSGSFAQDYVRYRLPEGRRIHLSSPSLELQAFTFDEYLVLLEMDADLKESDSVIANLRLKERDYLDAVSNLESALTKSDSRLTLCKEESARLDTQLQKSLNDKMTLQKTIERKNTTLLLTYSVGGAAVLGLVLGLVFGG